MKKKRLKTPIILFAILLLSNIFSGYINFFSEGLFETYLYQTENAEFEFTTMPAKGRCIEMMKRQFSHFKETHPEYQDLKLFRTFKRNPLKFWNYYSYLTSEMFQYDYQIKVESQSGKGKFVI